MKKTRQKNKLEPGSDSIRTDKALEHDAESSSGFPHHAAFFLGGAPEQFKPLRQIDEADVEAGAAGRIIDNRAVDDRVARRNDDLPDLGHLSGRSNPCKSARVIHPEALERLYSPQHNPGSEITEK